jgi:chemotaxis protein histidine kinase CheA/ActR/RegA family two-component response regulator
MSSSFDKFAILDSFLDEVGSYLPEIEANLDRLEQVPDDSEALEEAYRRAHTIGGSASMMDFPGLSQVAHAMEDVLMDALDEVLHLDGAVLALLRRSLARARLLLEAIKTGAPDEGRVVAEDTADYAAFRQRSERAAGGDLVQEAIVVTPNAPTGSRRYAQAEDAVDELSDRTASSEASSPGAPQASEPQAAADSVGPGDWLSLLGDADLAASEQAGEPLSGAPSAAEAGQDVELREHITQPLPRITPADLASVVDSASGALETGSDGGEFLLAMPASDDPTLVTATDEQQPSLAEMLAAFRSPPSGEWPEQPIAPAEPAPALEASAVPEASTSSEHVWESLLGRDGLAAATGPLAARPQESVIPASSIDRPAVQEPGGDSTISSMPAWQQVVEQEEQVRQGAASLKETLAALRAVASAIENERTELRGFLDGSKDAIDRLEDWAGRAMGLNLRQSPDHVRRYLPLSVLWVVTTRLKKILGLLKDAATSLTTTDGKLSAASMQLAESIRACGPLISSVLAMAAPTQEGGFSATVAHFSWNPASAAEPEPLSSEKRDDLRAQIRAELEPQLRAEVAQQVRREEIWRLRQELEIEVRQQVLMQIQHGQIGQLVPAVSTLPQGSAVTAPQPRSAGPKKVVRPVEQSEEALEVFRAEAEEHLQSIGEGVTALERSPGDRDILQGIRRATHTLKGAAAMMGFVHIADLAHIFEDLLDRIMEASIEITTDVLSLILDTSEALESLVSGKTEEREGEAVVDALRPRYRALLGQADEEVDTAPASAGASEGAEAEAAGALTRGPEQEEHQLSHLVELAARGEATDKNDLSVRIRLKKLDELVDLFGELLVNRTVLEERLGRLMRMVADVNLSSTRLHEVGTQLESRFEAAALPSGRVGQMPALENTGVAGSSARLPGRSVPAQGRALTLPPEVLGGDASKTPSYLADFDELELDRYTEFHRLIRGLSEGVSDMSTLGTEMEAIIRECEGIFAKETRLSSAFQDQLLKVRLVPISTMIPRLYRAARTVALRLGKEIALEVEGEETEVDRTIYEEMAGALLHVVRNAVTHGIETPDVREAAGKPRAGQIKLAASYEGNQIVITVRDDGTGIDAERVRNTAIARGLLDARAPLSEQAVLNLIFRPGFSTAEAITEESGRGVGLDVVADVAARLRGSVEVESAPGNGSAFTMKFPISLQIQRAVLVRVSTQTYAIPMALVEQIGRLDYYERASVQGGPGVMMRGEAYALVHLAGLLNMPASKIDERSSVLLVAVGRQRYALVVDMVMGKQEIVVKNLGLHLREVRGVAGATVLGSGQVVLILDVLKLLEQRSQTAAPGYAAISGGGVPAAVAAMPTRSLMPTWSSTLPAVGRGQALTQHPARTEEQYVLVVDDSPSVRRVVSNMLKTAGWEVQTARDGMEALDVAAKRKPAAVLLDIEMPRMDGYELIATLRSQEQYKHLPLVVLTSRAANKHHARAMQLGADAYLVKPYQDEELINTLNTLVRGAQASG